MKVGRTILQGMRYRYQVFFYYIKLYNWRRHSAT